MIRRPPRSTLFPYTRSSDLMKLGVRPVRLTSSHRRERTNVSARRKYSLHWIDQARVRSEEHTSELQSLAYLVCRLLLEKKKIKVDQAYSQWIQSHLLYEGTI